MHLAGGLQSKSRVHFCGESFAIQHSQLITGGLLLADWAGGVTDAEKVCTTKMWTHRKLIRPQNDVERAKFAFNGAAKLMRLNVMMISIR